MATMRERLRELGPGLVSGASDNDPSGIATYSQAGAQFGYPLAWTVVLAYPLMVAIQLACARIGRVTGRGLAANVRARFPKGVLYALVALLFAANTINIAADIAAMGEAVRLVAGGPAQLYAVAFGVLCVTLEIAMPYRRYARLLKWLTLALFSYVAVVFTVHVEWLNLLRPWTWPRVTDAGGLVTVVVAVLGTTITPYLFFWQAAQEVEEVKADPDAQALKRVPRGAARELRRIRFDTQFGMAFSNLIALFIIVSTAATLHEAGVTDIRTSAQAAEALRPLAGDFAFLLFSLGIVGTGLLAVPVLAGSAAYAVAEAFQWKRGLDLKPHDGRRFYAIVALATLGGVALGFTAVDPIKALFWTAVLNGVVAVPMMAVTMLLAGSREVMGAFATRRGWKALGWLATATMAVVVVAMFAV
jgi:NRAMP (natural resistance-associated macrophage protein)-like metal ion transporter